MVGTWRWLCTAVWLGAAAVVPGRSAAAQRTTALPATAAPVTAAPTSAARSAGLSLPTLARTVLAELVAVNTTRSGGSTTPAVRQLAARFRAAGWPTADVIVAGVGPKSQNLIVRWRGTTRAKPVVFNAHLDVVEAPRADWATDPFRLTERAGYLYGRGVIDNKGPAAAMAAAFLAARAQGVVPVRDLVLVLSAGEETQVENGVQWALAARRPLVDAEYVLNLDAGGAEREQGTVRAYIMQAAEKVYADFELRTTGPGGHSSVPDKPTPIDRLADALARLARDEFPVRLNAVTRAYFAARGPLTNGPAGAAMTALARDADDLAAQQVLLRDPFVAASLRTTCLATMLRAGSAPNAIANDAAATVNCRVLPGERVADVADRLRRVVRDSAVSVRLLEQDPESPPSMPDAFILALMQEVLSARYPGVPIIPYMETGGTDALWFRKAGIPTYGVGGSFGDPADYERLHGNDERLSVAAFREMVDYSDRLLRAVAKRPPRP